MAAMRRNSAWPLAAAALALAVWAAPAGAQVPATGGAPPGAGGSASADPRCDPRVAHALAESARQGVEADLAIVRHPDQGIRDPDSILDFSCITDLFDYRAFDILFDPAGALDDILDLARRRICAAARDAYRSYLGRTLDPAIYTVPARRLPGLDFDWRRRDVFDDLGANDGASDGGSELFRGVVEGGR